MRRFLIPLAALLLLVACAPAVQADFARDDGADEGIVTIQANEPRYAAYLSAIGGTTEDERCFELEREGEFACELGTMAEGASTQVEVLAPGGDFSCVVHARTRPLDMLSLRIYPCQIETD